MEIREPQTEEEFKQYYDLRWRLLRKQLNQPRGSEKDDEYEDAAIHIVAVDSGIVIGVGRAHFNSSKEAQLRFMAVEEEYRGQKIGSKIIKELEKRIIDKGAKYCIINARQKVLKFYEKNGYKIIGEGHMLFGTIPHYKMRKDF